MKAKVDKAHILAALRARVEHDLGTAVAAQKHTQAGATHEEAKPENDKDTRALESSYLARGQAQRVAELTRDLATLSAFELKSFQRTSPIALSAVVALDDGTEVQTYFLAPVGGGVVLEVQEQRVRVLTPASPLGRALIGQREGGEVDVTTPRGTLQYSVSYVL